MSCSKALGKCTPTYMCRLSCTQNHYFLQYSSLYNYSSNSTTSSDIKKKLKTESDGFSWYLISKDGMKGAQSIDGEIIIPLGDYSLLYYSIQPKYLMGGFFYVVSKDYKYKGVFDKDGDNIIPISRGYSHIVFYDRGLYFGVTKDGIEGVCRTNGDVLIPLSRGYSNITYIGKLLYVGYFQVEKNGKKGVCDRDGIEIIKPTYRSIIFKDHEGRFEYKDSQGNWIPLDYTLDESGRGVRINNSTSTTSAIAKSSTDRTSNNSSSDCQTYLKKAEQAKDVEEKVMFIQQAADCGDEQSQFEMGYVCYDMSEKIREKIQGMSDADSDKKFYKILQNNKGRVAIEYLDMAAKTGHPGAQALLCVIYFEGDIVKRDIDVAKSWAKKVHSNNRSTEKEKKIVNYVEGKIEEWEKELDWFLGF